jgi:hypothetical protein
MKLSRISQDLAEVFSKRRWMALTFPISCPLHFLNYTGLHRDELRHYETLSQHLPGLGFLSKAMSVIHLKRS